MSVPAIVKKDYQDGIRSKLLWGLIALFVLFVGGIAYLSTDGGLGEAQTTAQVLAVLAGVWLSAIVLLVPLTGLVVSVKSITRERELGTIKVLLSLPHSRRDVVIGKFLGRSGLLTTAILAGFVPGGLLLAVRMSDFPAVEFLMFLLVTILFGLAFVAVGIGVSALTSTETRATVAGVAVFVLLYAWQGILGFVNGRLDLLGQEAMQFVNRFHLFNVFMDTLLALISLRHDIGTSASVVVQGSQQVQGGEFVTAGAQPFYFQHWFAFVILALWIVVPLAIGYVRFENVDL